MYNKGIIPVLFSNLQDCIHIMVNLWDGPSTSMDVDASTSAAAFETEQLEKSRSIVWDWMENTLMLFWCLAYVCESSLTDSVLPVGIVQRISTKSSVYSVLCRSPRPKLARYHPPRSSNPSPPFPATNYSARCALICSACLISPHGL